MTIDPKKISEYPNYAVQIKIASYDVNQNNELRVSCLMQHFQQIARENLDIFELTYDRLREHDIVFVLSRYTIHRYAPMRADETYTFYTAPAMMHGPYFIRDFLVTDQNGTVVVDASTAWVIIRFSDRKLLRPNALPVEIPLGTRLVDYLPDRTDVRENFDDSYTVTVLNSMLDANNHLNNCHYADIVIDGLYENGHENSYANFCFSYVHEAHFHDTLEIDYTFEETVCYVRVFNKTQNNICFTAVLS